MNSKFKDYCNIIKVKNIQQVENRISGVQNKEYVQSREMFCVYTDDKKYQKLYTYNDTPSHDYWIFQSIYK